MIQQATVVALVDHNRAQVKVKRQSACGHDCETCGGGCGALTVMPTIVVEAQNLAKAQEGDRVTVASSSKGILGIAVVVYMIPIFLFLIGYFVASSVGITALGASLIGVAAFALGGLFAMWWDRHMKKKNAMHYTIVAVEETEH